MVLGRDCEDQLDRLPTFGDLLRSPSTRLLATGAIAMMLATYGAMVWIISREHNVVRPVRIIVGTVYQVQTQEIGRNRKSLSFSISIRTPSGASWTGNLFTHGRTRKDVTFDFPGRIQQIEASVGKSVVAKVREREFLAFEVEDVDLADFGAAPVSRQ